MRKARSGHIINISSLAGFAPGTGWSIYGAAKSAINGLSAGLINDLEPLGIRVTIVSPGAFRTSFATAESLAMGETQLPDYPHIRKAHQKLKDMDGQQLGDPDRVADALLSVVADPNPPANLFLGSDAYARAASKIEALETQLNAWKEVTCSTDFA